MESIEDINQTLTDEEVIERFLLDIDCLDELDPWISGINIFEVLKITNTEIRHSNVLGWLLDPSESHGFSDGILKELVTSFILENKEHYRKQGIKSLEMLLLDYDSFSVRREWNHIDLFLISEKEKTIICIENKIDSSEHSNQLERYMTGVLSAYPNYQCFFVYLTPSGDSSSDEENWVAFSYQNVMEIIENNMGKYNLAPEAQLLINNYISTIRRFVVTEDKLTNICSTIYKKHKRALDLIFENRPDDSFRIFELLVEYCKKREIEKGDIFFASSFSTKSYIRFSTPYLDSILPPDPQRKGGWGYGPMYFYEIKNNKNQLKIQLVLSSKDLDDNSRQDCEKIWGIISDKKPIKEDWFWKSIKSWGIPASKNIGDMNVFEEDEELLNKILSQIDRILDYEIPKLEGLIKDKW